MRTFQFPAESVKILTGRARSRRPLLCSKKRRVRIRKLCTGHQRPVWFENGRRGRRPPQLKEREGESRIEQTIEGSITGCAGGLSRKGTLMTCMTVRLPAVGKKKITRALWRYFQPIGGLSISSATKSEKKTRPGDYKKRDATTAANYRIMKATSMNGSTRLPSEWRLHGRLREQTVAKLKKVKRTRGGHVNAESKDR